MSAAKNQGKVRDPLELLDQALKQTWNAVTDFFDICEELPSMRTLFEGANLPLPSRAAETVFVNMLIEIIEQVGRFSPWYTKPARAFGLIQKQDIRKNTLRWTLAPEAYLQWRLDIKDLEDAIDKNLPVIKATLLVEDLASKSAKADSPVPASCQCCPPKRIWVKKSLLEHGEIICEMCDQPFRY